MNRYLYRVAYSQAADPADSFSVATVQYEPVCVRALTEAAALVDVEDATARYLSAVGGTRTITLVTVTADV